MLCSLWFEKKISHLFHIMFGALRLRFGTTTSNTLDRGLELPIDRYKSGFLFLFLRFFFSLSSVTICQFNPQLVHMCRFIRDQAQKIMYNLIFCFVSADRSTIFYFTLFNWFTKKCSSCHMKNLSSVQCLVVNEDTFSLDIRGVYSKMTSKIVFLFLLVIRCMYTSSMMRS